MCKLGMISQERLKVGVKLLLSANRKSYMPCKPVSVVAELLVVLLSYETINLFGLCL